MARNKKGFERWVKQVGVVGASIIAVLIVFNLLVDFNGVFGLPLIHGFNVNKAYSTSDRITKFYYAKRVEPQTILMGSSRTAGFGREQLGRLVSGTFYNLSLANPSIYEQYEFLACMVGQGKTRHVFLAVDFFSFNPTRQLFQTGFSKTRCDTGMMLDDVIDSLITFSATENSVRTVITNIKGKAIEKDYRTGVWTWVRERDELRKHGQGVIRKKIDLYLKTFAEAPFFYHAPLFRNPSSVDADLKRFERLVAYSRTQGVKLTVFVSPVHHRQIDLIYEKKLGETYERWKRELAKITEYYDFSGPSGICSDDRWWWDSSHIRAEGGTLIFARLAGDPDGIVPADFGYLVTERNVDDHVNRVRQGVRPLDLRSLDPSS